MPRFGPIKREDLIRYLRYLQFSGPYSGSKHAFMVKETITLWIPNAHQGDIGKELLSRILRQAQITKTEWEML